MSAFSMTPKSEAVAIVEDSIRRGKTTRDGAAEARAALACRYYESVPEQITDMTSYYSTLYKNSSTWHTTRPKIAYNLVKGFADELGQLYNRPVKREFERPQDEATWAKIGAGHTPLMQNVDRYALLTGLVAVRPVVMPDYRLAWTYYTRDQIEYVPDALDPNVPHWLVVSFKHGDVTIKHWWSATHYVRTVDDVVSYTDADEKAYPGGRHNYKRIPLVLFRNDAAGRGFFGEPATDLVMACREINFQCSRMNWTMVWQGASVMVMTGGDDSKLIEIGPESRVGLPKDATLGYASPDPKIDNTIAAINLNLMLFCKSRRIPEDAFLLQRQGESGVALVARQASLEDYRQARGELFRPQEQDLIQLALQVYGLSQGNGFSAGPPCQIQYEKPIRPMSDALLAELIYLKQQNVITAADILVAREPGLSRKAAVKRIEENRKENMSNGGMVEEPVFKDDGDGE